MCCTKLQLTMSFKPETCACYLVPVLNTFTYFQFKLQWREDELLKDLIPHVVISSKLTMTMKWLFIPTFCYLLAFVFATLDVYVDAPADKLIFLMTERYNTLHMKLPPVFLPSWYHNK